MPFPNEIFTERSAGQCLSRDGSRASAWHDGNRSMPVRPARHIDEWDETYLGRVARAHGVVRPWRGDLERLRPAVLGVHDCCSDGAPAYAGEALPGWAVVGRSAQIRYCYACLLEKRYVRARWRLACFSVCTLHGVNLKGGLVEPAITTAYKHRGRRPVEDMTAEEAVDGATSPTPQGLRYARRVWGPFERAVSCAAGDAEVSCALAWALLVERLVDASATALRGPDYPPRHVPRTEHRCWWLSKMGLAIAPNRNGVLSFLLGLSLSAHRRAALACLSRLMGDELRRRTVMSRLPLQELKDRLLAADPIPKAESTGALPRAKHPAGCKSLEATETVLGCSPSLLYYLVQEHHFKGVQKIRFGRKQYVFIPDAEVERFRRFFASCMTFDELLQSLAIDRQAYWVLNDCALLNPVELGSWRRYRRQEVAALLTRLDDASRPMPASAKHIEPLMGPWLHMRRRVRPEIRTVLDELLAGRLPLYKNMERQGLQAYCVDYAAPARLRWLSEAHHAAQARQRTMATQRSLWDVAWTDAPT